MKLKQLEFVRAVADTSSFSRAADVCHATQPTLSTAIGQLEDELGGKLFKRTTRKVELTAFGRHLMPFVHSVLESRSELDKAASAYRDPVHKLLRIGFSPLVDTRIVEKALEPFRAAHPGVDIFFKECFLDDMDARLMSETIDIVVVPQAPRNMLVGRCSFYSDQLYYLPRDGDDHGSAGVPMRVADVPPTPVIMTGGGCGLNGSLEELFKAEGATLTAYPGQAMSYTAIEDWVSLGVGAGILPGSKRSFPDKPAIPLILNDGRPAVFSFEWIWNAALTRQTHIAAFIAHIKTIVPDLLGSGVASEIGAG